MSMRILLGILTMAVMLGTRQTLAGENVAMPSVQTASVELIQLVSVKVTVLASEKELLVPYCGEDAGGTESLCILPAHLEVRSSGGWRPVKLRHSGASLGGVPMDRRRVRVIPVGQKHDFSFVFPKEEFAVERGQRLRVVVAAWLDEQSMKLTNSRFN